MPRPETDLRDLEVFGGCPHGGHAHTWAEKVARQLAALGTTVRRDERSIRENDGWHDEIKEGFARADVCVGIPGRRIGAL